MLDFLLSALTWVEIIIGLGFLIFIHEAGHFLLAKRNGVRVEAFSLGMGPILWRRTWGETEYRISAIPLGGYVKMSGENIGDERTGAPHELTSKSAWARLQIFAAGALMNLVIAFPIAIAAFLAGMYVHPPVIAQPSLPDAAAGIQPGDRVLSANEKPVQSLDEYRKVFVTLRKGTAVPVKVLRGDEQKSFTVETAGSERHGTRPPSTTIMRIKPGSPAAKGLKDYDEIIAINDEPVLHAPVVREKLQQLAGKPVRLKVRNRDEPGTPERQVELVLPGTPQRRVPADLHLMEAVVEKVVPDHSAADAGLRAGDRIRTVENRDIRSYHDLKEALADHAGRKVTLEVERGGKIEKLPPLLVGFNEAGKGQLGVHMAKTTRIADVVEGSHYEKVGLKPGDVLLKIGDKHGEISVDEFAAFGRIGDVRIEVQRGPEKKTLDLKAKDEVMPDFESAGFEVVNGDKTQLALGFNFVERRWSFGEAVSDGLREPIIIVDMTVKVLQKLFVGEERASGLAGPAGIFKASHIHARLSLGNFLWLLILITVNLGIVNLLPIPVLDGGHILLLAIEKVRGAPPSPRFVERFQLVGLIFLLGLLIFVTMNDFRNIL